MNWKLICIISLLLAAWGVVWGQTEVSGDVSGEWTLSGDPYIVIGNCTVPHGESLTIEPGVQVLFDGYFWLKSLGTLIAEGTESDSIIFTSNDLSPSIGDWRYVKIEGVGASASSIKFCRFSYGDNGVYVDDSEAEIRRCDVLHQDGSGVRITNSEVMVHQSNITDCDRGISVSSGAVVTIQYCEIHENRQDGIYVTTNASGTIQWNTIHRNSIRGLYFLNAGAMTVRRNVIAANTSSGIFTSGTYDVNAWNNTITQNVQHGIHFYDSPLMLVNTIVDRNGLNGLYNQNSSFSFLYNDVWNNGTDYVDCTPGPGDFSSNPLYVNPGSDYHLQEESECIDAGWPSSQLDPDGTRADVGVYYFDQNTPPEILAYGPMNLDTVEVGEEVTFWISAYDPDGDSLRFEWWYWEELVGSDSTLTVQFTDPGAQRMVGKVLDGWGGGEDSVYWYFMVVDTTDVPLTKTSPIPQEIHLGSAYPNPFNSSVVIPFSVPQADRVKLTIFDVSGREVEIVFDQRLTPGHYRVRWEAIDVPSGIYFTLLESSNATDVGKVISLK